MSVAVVPGLEGEASLTVTQQATAIVLRSGDVPVLATPMVVALCEEATVAAVEGHLAAGQTTVGVRVTVEHIAPSVVGAEVVANARVVRVEGRAVDFEVSVTDDGHVVATGTVERVIVDRELFISRAS